MPKSDPSAKHIEAAKRRLAHLAGLRARTLDSERRILDRAVARDGDVTAEMAKLRPAASVHPVAADRYQALVLEAGTLAKVIGQSRRILAGAPA